MRSHPLVPETNASLVESLDVHLLLVNTGPWVWPELIITCSWDFEGLGACKTEI